MLDQITGLDPTEYEAAKKAVLDVRRRRWRDVLGASGQPLVIFAAQQNADLTEGRGPYVPRAHFLIEDDANVATELLEGVQGTANEAPVDTLRVYLTVDEWLGEVDHNRVMLKRGRSAAR